MVGETIHRSSERIQSLEGVRTLVKSNLRGSSIASESNASDIPSVPSRSDSPLFEENLGEIRGLRLREIHVSYTGINSTTRSFNCLPGLRFEVPCQRAILLVHRRLQSFKSQMIGQEKETYSIRGRIG